MKIQTIAFTLIIACSSAAEAQNPARGWYLGLDAGSTQLSGSLTDTYEDVVLPYNEDSRAFVAHTGYRFNRFLQLGAYYGDYGTFSVSGSGYRAAIDMRAVGIQFTGRLPIGEKFGLLAQMNAFNRRMDVTIRAPGEAPDSDHHGGVYVRWGFGVNYQFNPEWDVRLEHATTIHDKDGQAIWFPERFELTSRFRTTTLGFRYKFPRGP